MTETKWTPGPWRYDEHGQDGHGDYVVANGAPVDWAIARIIGDNVFVPYNANLIAAAPELYEALADMLSDRMNGPDSADIWYRAKAALAKARGETP